VGPDELLFTGLVHGAGGSMSGLTGVLPEAVRRMIDAARSGDFGLARRIQFEFLELLNLAADLPFPAFLKLMLSVRGFEMGPPLQAQSMATRRRMDERRPAILQKIEAIIQMLETANN
jgi:dihydrodipicolinate synthase/N-acetylneuraminate lyase